MRNGPSIQIAKGFAVGIAVVAAGLFAAGPSMAAQYSSRVRNACSDDYFRFCNKYEEGSPKLRSCMRAQGRRLSPGCIRALVDAGMVSKKELAKYKR